MRCRFLRGLGAPSGWRWLLVLALVGTALGVLGLLVEPAARRMADREVRSRIEALSLRLGRPIEVGRVEFGLPDRLVLHGLSVDLDDEGLDGIRMARMRVRWSPWAWLRGDRRPSGVTLEGPRMVVSLDGGRPRVWEEVGRRLLATTGGASPAEPATRLGLGIEILDGSVEVRDSGSKEVLFRLGGLEGEGVREGGEWRLEGRGRLLAPEGVVSPWTMRAHRETSGAWIADLQSEEGLVIPSLPGVSWPGRVSWKRLLVERSADGGTLEAIVEDLRLDPLSWKGNLPTWIQSLDRLGAEEARITVPSERSLSEDLLGRVETLVLRNVWGEARVGGPFPGVIRLSDGHLDLSRGEAGTVTLSVQGRATTPDGQDSRGQVTVHLGDDGAPREVRGRMVGGGIPWFLSLVDPHVLPWPGSFLEVQWIAEGDGRRFRFRGDASGRGLSYFWTKICLVPVTDLSFSAILAGDLDLDRHKASLRLDPWNVGPAVYGLEVEVERLGRPQPKVSVRFTVPRQSCQAVASSIPPVLVPRLEGMRFSGSMNLDLQVSVDLAGLSFTPGGPVGRTVVKGVQLRFDGDLEGCEALTLGRQVRLESLDGPLVFRIPPGEKPREEPAIEVGPGTPSYVPLERIPEPVWQAALATEDMGFFKHKGFKLGLIRRAIVLNLDRGWYVYGGSTITQQLVKNLFLSREKTLARKLEEAIIVWQLERRLTKERILELYLNVIEFGRRIYGIRAAAQAYFRKEPEELTPLEGAFLMATKPAPVYAWRVYQKRQFSRWWVERLRGILLRLWQEMQVIDEKTYLEAAPYLPLFWYPEEGIYAYPAVDPSLLVPPGMPTELPGRVPEVREDRPTGAEEDPSVPSP